MCKNVIKRLTYVREMLLIILRAMLFDVLRVMFCVIKRCNIYVNCLMLISIAHVMSGHANRLLLFV